MLTMCAYLKKKYDAPEAPELILDEETIGQNIDPSIANHAIKDGFSNLGSGKVVVFGGGGEPTVGASENAIDGESSLSFDFPRDKWGGAYIKLDKAANLNTYKTLKFSIKKPAAVENAEIKLESSKTNAAVFLKTTQAKMLGKNLWSTAFPYRTSLIWSLAISSYRLVYGTHKIPTWPL